MSISLLWSLVIQAVLCWVSFSASEIPVDPEVTQSVVANGCPHEVPEGCVLVDEGVLPDGRKYWVYQCEDGSEIVFICSSGELEG
jgi:hypothetical protein